MRPLRKAAKQFRTFICIAAWRVLSSLRFSFIVSTEPKNKLDRLPAACDDHRNQLLNTLGVLPCWAEVSTNAAFLGAERVPSSVHRLQRECEEMDCAFRVRRDYRTGQTEGSNTR